MCWRYDLGIRKSILETVAYRVDACSLFIVGVVAWNMHGSRQYDAGYAQAQEDQKQADDKARSQRDQERTQIEREAQSRIDVARVDAEHANAAADSLRAELDKTKRLTRTLYRIFPHWHASQQGHRCARRHA